MPIQAPRRHAARPGRQALRLDQTLRDLSRALPSDVTVKSLSRTLGGATASPGAAKSTSTTPSVNLTGCTRNQKSVARLMARLSTVNGVTRVKLANSTKAAAATAPATSAGSAAEGPPCGEGRRPDFNVTIEFAGVAAAAAPATSTPAAPATAAASATTPATPAATPTPATGGTQASTTATTQGGAK
jgi:hypothetical protein